MTASSFPNGITTDGAVTAASAVIGGNTLSGTELGYVDGVTPGTVTASKALVANSDGNVGAIKVTAFNMGATGSEVNYSALITTLAGVCAGATIATPGAEAAEAVTTSVQLEDFAGADMAARAVVGVYVSTDAAGDSPGDGNCTIAITAGTDGAVISHDAALPMAMMVSEADGDLDIVLTDSAAASQTMYLNVVLPTGAIVTSSVITFAA